MFFYIYRGKISVIEWIDPFEVIQSLCRSYDTKVTINRSITTITGYVNLFSFGNLRILNFCCSISTIERDSIEH